MLIPSVLPMSTCVSSNVPGSCLRPIGLYTHLICIYICRDLRGLVHGSRLGLPRLSTAAMRRASPVYIMCPSALKVVARSQHFDESRHPKPHGPKMNEASLFFRLELIPSSARGTSAIVMHLNANAARNSRHNNVSSQRHGPLGPSPSRSKYHATSGPLSWHIDTPSIGLFPYLLWAPPGLLIHVT